MLGLYPLVYYVKIKSTANFQDSNIRELCRNYIRYITRRTGYTFPLVAVEMYRTMAWEVYTEVEYQFQYDIISLELEHIKKALILVSLIEEIKLINYKDMLMDIQQYQGCTNFGNWLRSLSLYINIYK